MDVPDSAGETVRLQLMQMNDSVVIVTLEVDLDKGIPSERHMLKMSEGCSVQSSGHDGNVAA